jgi:hypothetical protein
MLRLTRHQVAEKTFKRMTALAAEHESVKFIAVSHSSQEATERWIPQVGGTWGIEVITDEERDLYSAWGLGISSTWHALSPSVLWSVYRLGKDEGIWNRPTESGSRWQTSGAFAVSRFGSIAWSHVAVSAADIPNLDEALLELGVASQKTPQ